MGETRTSLDQESVEEETGLGGAGSHWTVTETPAVTRLQPPGKGFTTSLGLVTAQHTYMRSENKLGM